MTNFKEDILKVKGFVLDCDGVLTDGGILMLPDGEPLRIYNAKDGFAISMALAQGFKVAIISGGKGKGMEARFGKLQLKDVYLGCHDKVEALKEFASKHDIELSELLYIGDDIPDIDPMMQVGVACSPKDAVSEVKEIVKYVSNYCGGKGCVRDIIEQVLKSQDKWIGRGSEKDILSL